MSSILFPPFSIFSLPRLPQPSHDLTPQLLYVLLLFLPTNPSADAVRLDTISAVAAVFRFFTFFHIGACVIRVFSPFNFLMTQTHEALIVFFITFVLYLLHHWLIHRLRFLSSLLFTFPARILFLILFFLPAFFLLLRANPSISAVFIFLSSGSNYFISPALSTFSAVLAFLFPV